MDFERGIDIELRKPMNKESSYSEEEQAKIIEGATMDVKQLRNKRKATTSLSRKEKIIDSYKTNLDKILSLVEALSELESRNARQEEQIVDEIKILRRIQEELLNALILEQKGGLTEESISKEAWDLIQ